MLAEDDRRRVIYDQDCQFHRYQDEKKWGRFKVITTIEGAILFGLYQAPKINDGEKLCLLAAGSLLIVLVASISWKDQSDADSFLDRMREYEACSPFKPRAKIRFGRYLMVAASLVLIGLNATLIVRSL